MRRLLLAIGICLFIFCLTFTVAYRGQSARVQAQSDRIDRLEAELKEQYAWITTTRELIIQHGCSPSLPLPEDQINVE